MTIYAVRRKQCGCLVSSRLCRSQAAAVGSANTHPDRSTTVVMSVHDAARVPELCREHAAKLEKKQEGLFDGN